MFRFARRSEPIPPPPAATIEPTPTVAVKTLTKQYIRVLRIDRFSESALTKIDTRIDGEAPSLAIAFVSPHLDFRTVAQQLKSCLPPATIHCPLDCRGIIFVPT